MIFIFIECDTIQLLVELFSDDCRAIDDIVSVCDVIQSRLEKKEDAGYIIIKVDSH